MSITVAQAEAVLNRRFRLLKRPTKYIAGFELPNGRQIALRRGRKGTRLFVDAEPPPLAGVQIEETYGPNSPRSSNLVANAPRLAVPNPACLVVIASEAALELLLNWYSIARTQSSNNGVQADQELVGDIEIICADPSLSETVKKALVDARIGQGQFRAILLTKWKRCPVFQVSTPQLLRASHIKPWRESSNEERLDPSNGILLSSAVDAAFDAGLVTFDENGSLVLSTSLPRDDAENLGFLDRGRVSFTAKHQAYLNYHREKVFLGK